MKPTTAQYKAVQTALLDAFPNHSDLRRMVRNELGEKLDVIAGNDGLRNVVFQLVEWADSEGKLNDLIKAAYRDKPANQHLRELIADLQLNVVNNDLVIPRPEDILQAATSTLSEQQITSNTIKIISIDSSKRKYITNRILAAGLGASALVCFLGAAVIGLELFVSPSPHKVSTVWVTVFGTMSLFFFASAGWSGARGKWTVDTEKSHKLTLSGWIFASVSIIAAFIFLMGGFLLNVIISPIQQSVLTISIFLLFSTLIIPGEITSKMNPNLMKNNRFIFMSDVFSIIVITLITLFVGFIESMPPFVFTIILFGDLVYIYFNAIKWCVVILSKNGTNPHNLIG